MGGENQVIAGPDIAPQLGDHGVGVAGPGYDGVAVVAQHVRVDRVDFGNLHIKSLRRLVNDEPDAANGDLPLGKGVGDRMDGAVEAAAKDGGKLVDQGFAPAAAGIFRGVGSGVFGGVRQEGGACAVIGHQHTGHIQARLDGHKLPRLLHQKHLVRQGVPGLIGVELHAAKIIDVHFALGQPDGGKVSLVHDVCLH